jgi:haloalkane dehalogenase
VVATRSLDLDGLAYRYVDQGAGQTVVMLHGNPSWSYMYRSLIAALSDRYRVIVPDHLGMGASDTPPRSSFPYGLARRVDDLARLLTHLDLDAPVTLVVHDWGGMIGLAWAVEHPDRVHRLVLLNTAAFPLPAGKRLPAALRLARTPLLGPALVRGLNAFALGATVAGVRRGRMPAEVRRGYLAPYRSWRRRAGIQDFLDDIPVRASDRSHGLVAATAARLDRLASVPTLICWGVLDPVFDLDYLAEWQRRLPAAEVHRLKAGHYVLEDAAEEVAALVDAFLART